MEGEDGMRGLRSQRNRPHHQQHRRPHPQLVQSHLVQSHRRNIVLTITKGVVVRGRNVVEQSPQMLLVKQIHNYHILMVAGPLLVLLLSLARVEQQVWLKVTLTMKEAAIAGTPLTIFFIM
jgi:hypothetical protein